MQGLYWKKIALSLLVPGILGLAISQPVDEDYVSPDHDFMIGTNEQEYEVVPIHKSDIQKRSIDGRFHLQLTAFGEHIKLWLEPQVGVLATTNTPIFGLRTPEQILEYDHFMEKLAGLLYQNEKEAATMFIKETPTGVYELDGVIGGKGYNIYSMSDPSVDMNKLWYQTERFKRFIETTPEHERGNYSYHIVTKLPQKLDQFKALKTRPLNSTRPKRSPVPDVVYPEILVVVDYILFQQFQSNYYNLVKYLLAFWNSVDFNYRSFESPKFRLNIAGIVIAETPTSLPFMNYRHSIYPYDLLIDTALEESAQFVLHMEQAIGAAHSFDGVVTMTSAVSCTIKDGICSRGVAGLAHVGGICRLPEMAWYGRQYKPVTAFKSSIIYDNGGYSGINVATHELGHLFGSLHDGNDNTACSLNVGNLMAPVISYTANSSDWSYCSLWNIEQILNSPYSTCLFNEPQPGEKLVRFLPGKILDADAQCRAQGQREAYKYASNICVNLECYNYDLTLSTKYPGAVDGTSCGQDKICLHRQCIDMSTITY